VNRTAPRIVSAIEDLARQLHPEAFSPHLDDEKEKKIPPPAQPQLSLLGLVLSCKVPAHLEVCACAL
jgi:hypothetical protein